jgi:hypothetical protein
MDATIHIITNGDDERIKSTIKALKTYDFSYKMHVIPKHPTNGRLGCFLSHIKLYRYANKHNLDYIIIAEDNICSSNLLKDYDKIKKDVNTIITQPWEVIYLGGWVTSPYLFYTSTSFSTLYETHNTHGTSFYMIHKNLYKKMLSLHKKYIQPDQVEHIDNVINWLAKKPYVSVPLLFYRDYQIKSTNLYSSNPTLNAWISYWHYYYRHPTVIYYLQIWAIYAKFIIFILCLVLVLIIYIKFR